MILSRAESIDGADPPGTYRCTTVDRTGETSVRVDPDRELGLSHLRSCHDLPDGGRLWVDARGTPAHPNGRIVAPDGTHRSLFLGDGIASLQVAPDGLIWVGYFDEGLFGNAGWLSPIGGVGLVALDTTGAIVQHHGQAFIPALPTMADDCQVTVVSAREVWCRYDHRDRQHPVLLIRDGVGTFEGDLPGSGYAPIAVGTPDLLTVDRFRTPPTLRWWTRATADRWERLVQAPLADMAGQPLPGQGFAARGSWLWMLTDAGIVGVDANTPPFIAAPPDG